MSVGSSGGAKNAPAIVLCPCDSKAIGPAIQEANAAGVPVFTADIACLAPGVKVVAHVATDNYSGGRQAAVVVDGTSLAGGEGKVLGTRIGAFIIAVIQNGMNLTGVKSCQQKVVLGLVILGAVLLDRLKTHGWRRRRRNQTG